MTDVPNKLVKLVACAKDEAAYIPEWVFHHLKLGVDEITIYINNTSDTSIEILEKIRSNHPNVNYIEADKLLLNPPAHFKLLTNKDFYERNPLQAIIYTHALNESDLKKFDYIGIIDIDEFIVPIGNLKDILLKYQLEGWLYPLKMKWVLLSGDEHDFSPLSSCERGFIDCSFKTISPIQDKKLVMHDPHIISADGVEGKFAEDLFVFHRVLRSRNEYLSLIARSTFSVSKSAFGLKNNRRGWTKKGQKLNVKMMESLSKDYASDFSDFIKDCELSHDLKSAQQKILNGSNALVNQMADLSIANTSLIKTLMGTNIKHISIIQIMGLIIFWKLLHIFSHSTILNHKPLKESFQNIKRRIFGA